MTMNVLITWDCARLGVTGSIASVSITTVFSNLLNLSSFTISEANYLLTRNYHGIASFIYNYISSALLNHLFLTTSKYFPTFCICVLFVVFIIFLQAATLFMFGHLSRINFSLQCFVYLHSNEICSTSSFLKHNGYLPYYNSNFFSWCLFPPRGSLKWSIS